MLCVVTEDTERVLGERRMATLHRVASAMADAHTHERAAARLERAAGRERRGSPVQPDLPVRRRPHRPARGDQRHPGRPSRRPGNHPRRPDGAGGAGRSPPCWRAAPCVVDDLAERFAPLPGGAWSRPPTHAVAVPLTGSGRARPPGFLVAGLNPFRPFDQRYRSFLDLLAGQIGAELLKVDAYDAQRRRVAELAELDRAKTAFFSNVSHEFRTPLTLMLGPLDELRRDPAVAGDPALAADLQVVHRNGLRLGKLVNTLLDFSRLEAGRMRARFQPVELAR